MLDFLHHDKDPETGKVMRRVRSFVLREGRLTHGQRKALDTLWPRYGLERAQGALDARAEFGRDAPRVLEIGYGMGQSLASMAEAEPDKDFIGIEVHRPGVGALLLEIQERGLSNLRTYCDDAVDILKLCIPDGSLDRLQLYFPDPWHKKKHNKRRLIQAPLVDQLVTRPGGRLRGSLGNSQHRCTGDGGVGNTDRATCAVGEIGAVDQGKLDVSHKSGRTLEFDVENELLDLATGAKIIGKLL